MSDGRKSQLSIVEPAESASAVGSPGVPASTSRPDARRRPRVSKDDAHEIARLYAETSTPTSEIRERFGIGDSSLYRIVQQQGVALRGRIPVGSQSDSKQSRSPAAQRLRSVRTDQAQQSGSQPPRAKASTAARATRRVDTRSASKLVRQASVPKKTRSLPQAAVVRARDDRQHFRILFLGERIVQATDMHDALRQAESFGAVEITAVAQVN